ncbi:DNA-(apurinic or apyrimidinic site) lyase [Quillaja saponaria]|uniref:DNA-(apurinic or apyrimidinic site) endonuclease 2 n=1 Tax=Quillaja saponaria TaxID=32244 RepID=A0AAD7KQY3_QUISA|nr:DNA-(apurinic or apyrimidinic site) lyase [Quillaja saponaria]
MKVVTYNVNGLRPRIAQFGTLRNLLSSFDADIICFQETKLRRQELTADLVMAEGYESFFSCTRTSDKGRTGYAGVATFCRVKSAFSSNEVNLPISAEEGFTGLIGNSHKGENEMPSFMEGTEDFSKGELLKVDCEGRCIITDHDHFVLFNLYGPRAECDDTERIQFKLNFFKILQKRWEFLLRRGRRLFVVGDLNIAPFSIDCCDAGPDFENNEFRRWFRSMLVEHGGHFFDVFRAKHPDRKDAYTCWPQNTGAEEFNYGTRIDHILCAGSCLHQADDLQGHNFVTCHVKECDILTQYKRWKPGSIHRWKRERSAKLEGSDHAPVYMTLLEVPDGSLHSTPSLSTRYIPMVHGLQQTLVSVLMKKRLSEKTNSCRVLSDENITIGIGCETVKGSSANSSVSGVSIGEACLLSSQEFKDIITDSNEISGASSQEATFNGPNVSESQRMKSITSNETRKKAKKSQWSQLSLQSFFQKCPNLKNSVEDSSTNISIDQAESSELDHRSDKTLAVVDQSSSPEQSQLNLSTSGPDLNDKSVEKEKSNLALLEWQRIQQIMQNSIPLCKGHKEPCVVRVVKKQGPNSGRRFYVCARAEGPASNPEANCGYFKWADSKSRNKA